MLGKGTNKMTLDEIKDEAELANKQYETHRAGYIESLADGFDGFHEHNEASYWKGKRDALINIIKKSNNYE